FGVLGVPLAADPPELALVDELIVPGDGPVRDRGAADRDRRRRAVGEAGREHGGGRANLVPEVEIGTVEEAGLPGEKGRGHRLYVPGVDASEIGTNRLHRLAAVGWQGPAIIRGDQIALRAMREQQRDDPGLTTLLGSR